MRAVATIDLLNDAFAAIAARQVEVDVGPARAAFREESLEEQIVADRAQVLGRNSYILSIVAAIFLPLGFLTGLFGVNVAGMPGTETEAAFWVLASFSAISGVVLFLIFKLAKWL